jgi:hypothetical protein
MLSKSNASLRGHVYTFHIALTDRQIILLVRSDPLVTLWDLNARAGLLTPVSSNEKTAICRP